MKEEINQLKNEIEELKRKFSLLENTTTIPFNVDMAFRSRLKVPSADTNDTSPSAYTKTVNEAGVSTYDVALPMNGFISIVVNNITRKIPFY